MNMKDGNDDWALLEDHYEERAAILEYDAGYTRYEAEQLAAQMYGFENKSALKKHVQKLKAKENEHNVSR
jgi:hypothetical protein